RFQLSYTGSNTSDRPDETKAFRRNVEKMKKEDLDLIPGFEETEKRIGNFMAWYNEQWSHSGQGMDGRTPLEVFREYAGPKREIPDHLKKYLFTVRCIKKVQRNGVRIEGEWFQHKDFVSHNGQDVEVRQSIDDAGIVHVFSLPDRVYLFDAEYLPNSGILRENIERKKKLQRDMNETAKKYNRMQEEFNRGPFSTPAETYAAEAAAELKVVNGEPLAAGPGPALTLVRAEPKKKKRLTILDVD
ncbi:MAG: Mu transposase C-terminal domain-containing protein, partial [Treponema sp.]|nr:Mu transposase C-terminal domain-containing protein [Treponema sp.]